MLNKNSFFKIFRNNSSKLNKNISKTKKEYKLLASEIKDSSIPMLKTYEKNYNLNFSPKIIKKFYKFENIVIIGMGGSILGAKSIYSFFPKKIKKKLFFFDNLDEKLHQNFSHIKNLKSTCFVIISKSGDTLETLTNLSIFFSKFSLKNKLIIITEFKNNNLIKMANKLNAEIVEHKDYVGGRYSVMSEVGMLPAILMGLNVKKFKNIKKLISNKKFSSILIQNVASIYTLNNKNIKNSVILNYDSDFTDLCCWYQQLIGESLGKKGKGITPILSHCPKDHHSVLQLYLDGPKDKFFTFISAIDKQNKYKISKKNIPDAMNFLKNKSLKKIVEVQCNATKNVFKTKKIPYRHFVLQKDNEEEIGIIFTFFILETILLARLLKVNPFNQPAVEQVKIEVKKILSK